MRRAAHLIGMHGIVFSELRQYVEAKLGTDAWPQLLKDAGLGAKIFLPVQSYPDEDMTHLVTPAARVTGLPAPAILEEVHRIVPKETTAAPPYLTAERKAPDEVHVKHDSARRLCYVAKGIVKGIAAHYREPITIDEPRCMHRGSVDCLLVIKRV